MSRRIAVSPALVIIIPLAILSVSEFAFSQTTFPRDSVPSGLSRDAEFQISLFYARDPVSRAMAARNLHRKDAPLDLVIKLLIGLLHDDTALVWRSANVLKPNQPGIEFPPPPGGHNMDTSPGREAARSLAEVGEPAVKPLIRALKSENRSVLIHASQALGVIGDRRGVGPLLAKFSDGDREVVLAAVWSAGEIGDVTAVEPLIGKLSEGRMLLDSVMAAEPGELDFEMKECATSLCIEAATALGKVKGKSAMEALFLAFEETHDRIRSAVRRSLVMIGESTIESLISILGNHNMSTTARTQAAATLGQIPDPRGIKALLGALNDADTQVRAYSADALGEIQDTSAVGSLIIALSDHDELVRREAALALSKIDDTRGIAPLIRALQDKDQWVRKYAKIALERITEQEFGEDSLKWRIWWEEGGQQ